MLENTEAWTLVEYRSSHGPCDVSLCCSEPYVCGTHHRETVILLKTYLKGSLMKL